MASIWLSSPEHRYDVMPVFMWGKKKKLLFFLGRSCFTERNSEHLFQSFMYESEYKHSISPVIVFFSLYLLSVSLQVSPMLDQTVRFTYSVSFMWNNWSAISLVPSYSVENNSLFEEATLNPDWTPGWLPPQSLILTFNRPTAPRPRPPS